MVIDAMSGLPHHQRIVIAILREHEDRWGVMSGIVRAYQDRYGETLGRIDFAVLDEPTSSQSETVKEAIKISGVTGPIFIKDSDGRFSLRKLPTVGIGNWVCTARLEDFNSINARNKSYCILGDHDRIDAIHEKKIVGTTFSTGGYAFSSAELFAEYTEKLLGGFPAGEVYVSHVIMAMLADGHTFHSVPVDSYVDWGTGHDWDRYCGGFKTFFCDIDGIIMKNAGRYFKPYRPESGPLRDNIDTLNRLAYEGNRIVLTTARPECERQMTEIQLHDAGLVWDDLVMGTLHAGRVLVNDFAASNQFPSAEAVNIPRNGELEPYLKKYYRKDK